MRHALGILGILAAGVLLAVSAAMNWRFGVSLGRTEFDGMIYGSASAAADCLKALIPFFLFAAIRNRMWSQAIAAAVVGTVVVSYSLTSALGHAALNRLDVSGKRQAEASTYKDLRADLGRAQEQAGWIPKHRPMLSVQADIDAAKTDAAWRYTNGCKKVTGPKGRSFCQSYHNLQAEFAAADQAAALEAKISELTSKLGKSKGGSVMAEADPQAAVLAKLAGTITAWDLKVDDVQTALTVFVALLLEIGSGLGLYVAFSQWRLYDQKVPSVARSSKRLREIEPVAQGAIPVVWKTSPSMVAFASPKAVVNTGYDVAVPDQMYEDTGLEPRKESWNETGIEDEYVAEHSVVPHPVEPSLETQQDAVVSDDDRFVEARGVEPEPVIHRPKREVRVTARAAANPLETAEPRDGNANDNRSRPMVAQRMVAPETDIERHYRENVESQDGASLTATELYEDYCAWCEDRSKEPMALPTFGRQFGELGVQKAKVAGRVRYIGIALRAAETAAEDKKQPAFGRKAA